MHRLNSQVVNWDIIKGGAHKMQDLEKMDVNVAEQFSKHENDEPVRKKESK